MDFCNVFKMRSGCEIGIEIGLFIVIVPTTYLGGGPRFLYFYFISGIVMNCSIGSSSDALLIQEPP